MDGDWIRCTGRTLWDDRNVLSRFSINTYDIYRGSDFHSLFFAFKIDSGTIGTNYNQRRIMKIIWLSDMKHCVKVDDEDYEKLIGIKWHYRRSRNTGYAQTRMFIKNFGKTMSVQMHRYIMDLEVHNKKQIDHIDRNGLNNQKSNLQICDHGGNSLNVGQRSSLFQGVKIKKNMHKKYEARFGLDYDMIYLGIFYTGERAALEYDDAKRKRANDKGFELEESICLNFPNISEEDRDKIINNENKAELKVLSKQAVKYRNVNNAPDKIKFRARTPRSIDLKRKLLGDFLTAEEAGKAVDYCILRNNAEDKITLNFSYTPEEVKLIKDGTLKVLTVGQKKKINRK